VHLWSYIRNVNKHFWHRCRRGIQYLLSIYRLHGIILASIISLTVLSTALCFFMVFTGSCMTRFDLLANYHSNPESLIRKFWIITRIFWIPRPRDCRQISGITTATQTRTDGCPECINDFSAPSTTNVRTCPEMNIRDGSFELKSALMNLVQQSPFCGKASVDANAHLQHFLEICSTFTIQGVT
jgi:hypothetical protein